MRALLAACLPVLLILSAPIAAADEGGTPSGPTWSAPQGVPAPRSPLPPPRVVVLHRTGPAVAQPLELPVPPPAPTYAVPPGRATILETPPPAPETSPPAVELASRGAEMRLPDAERDMDLAPPTPFVMPTESKVLAIHKNHNQPWHGNWLALELDMLLAVVGQAGQHVGATVTFYEVVNGRPLRASMQPYVDGEGTVCVYTKLVPIQSNSRLFRSRLKIPYRAFPWPTKGPTYPVQARVRLVQRDAAGNFKVLARGETSFTLHYERAPIAQAPLEQRRDRRSAAARNVTHDLDMMWSEGHNRPVSEQNQPPAVDQGGRRPWYEARWRTRGSTVDRKEAKWATGTVAH